MTTEKLQTKHSSKESPVLKKQSSSSREPGKSSTKDTASKTRKPVRRDSEEAPVKRSTGGNTPKIKKKASKPAVSSRLKKAPAKEGVRKVKGDSNTKKDNKADRKSYYEIAKEKSAAILKSGKKKVNRQKEGSMDDVENTAASKKSLLENTLDTAIGKKVINAADRGFGSVYRSIRTSGSEKASKKAKKRKNKYKQGFSQSIVPIKSISHGIILTTTGHYIKILEILPIDYYSLIPTIRNKIADNFSRVFDANSSKEVHLKVICDKNNPQRLIDHIKRACEEEKYQRGVSKRLISRAQDVINKAIAISENNSVSKRFFIIYRYEGHSSDFNEIFWEMESLRIHYTNVFAEMGNTIIEPDEIKDRNYHVADILYYFFNRKTYREESLADRINRIQRDQIYYNVSASEKRAIYDNDFLAPKGIHFTSSEYIFIDGIYKTFLCLRDDAHPSQAEAGWLDMFSSIGDGVEVDVYTKLLPRQVVLKTLEQKNRFDIVSARERQTNAEKQRNIAERVSNTTSIIEPMRQGEELYQVCIIITISAPTIHTLRQLKNNIVRSLNTQKFYTEDSYQYCWDYYRATLPLMEMPSSLFDRNKHNYLTSSLRSLYMFTAYEVNDPSGYMLGINQRNQSIVAINNFNTKIFTNANMSIFGSSGSGKTFTSEIIARSMRITGTRVMFVLPVKGYEYKRGCSAIGGTYIKLGPGQEDNINVMAIIPEQKIDRNMLSDDIAYKQSSLLSKKIAFLTTWLQLLDPKDEFSTETINLMSATLTDLYESFGITENNKSVYANKKTGELKPMPRIIDMYNSFMQYSALVPVAKRLLEFTSGTYKNFNRQTNVDLTSKYIVFDVDEADINKKYLPACIYIAFDCVYGLAKQNRISKDIIFLDEVWKMMSNEAAAEQVQEMVKLIRGYGGGVVLATQEINDYLKSSYGTSILNNTDTKLILKLKEQDCRIVSKELYLTEEEKDAVMHFKRGEALLLAGRNRIMCGIEPSQKEIEDFTTDPNILKRIKLEKAQRAKKQKAIKNNQKGPKET